MTPAGTDPALRQFERDAVAACLVMAGAAFVATAFARGPGAAVRASLAVAGGGLLMAFSYRAIKGAADLLVEIAVGTGPVHRQPDPREPGGAAGSDQPERATVAAAPPVLSLGRRARLAVKFFTRYALLAVAAYVMLTCFRLHPAGVLAGATAPFVAAVMQVGRLWRRGGRQPRY